MEVAPSLNRIYPDRNQPLRLTYAGRITNHEKRAGDLLVLAKNLHGRGVNFRLRVIGEGGYKKTLMNDLAAMPPDLQSRVRLEPMMTPDELASVWAETDVTLLVSDTESGGISLLEGMAVGAVPVSTRTFGPAEMIRHSDNGFLAEIGDMTGMAGWIKKLDDDRALLRTMGEKAHATVAASFSLDAYVPWFEQVLDNMWKQPARPWPARRSLFPPGSQPAGKSSVFHRLKRLFTHANR